MPCSRGQSKRQDEGTGEGCGVCQKVKRVRPPSVGPTSLVVEPVVARSAEYLTSPTVPVNPARNVWSHRLSCGIADRFNRSFVRSVGELNSGFSVGSGVRERCVVGRPLPLDQIPWQMGYEGGLNGLFC